MKTNDDPSPSPKSPRRAALIAARNRYAEARARAQTAWFEYEKAEAEAHDAWKDWRKVHRGEGKC